MEEHSLVGDLDFGEGTFASAERAVAQKDLELHSAAWCEANLKIKDKAGRISPLRYNYAQRELERLFVKLVAQGVPIRLFILKARQLGISTWVESVIYDWTTHIPYQDALTIAHDIDGTARLYEMFQTYHEHDPEALKTKVANVRALRFIPPHSSQIRVQTAGKRYAGTSLTVQLLHMSELAKWPNPKTAFLSMSQALPDAPRTFAVIESTAAGAGDYFNEQWSAESEWIKVFFPWFANPDYSMDANSVDMSGLGTDERYNFYDGEETDLLARTSAHICENPARPVAITMDQMAWRRWAIRNKCGGQVQLFHQEYPATPQEAFISAGSPRFNVAILQRLLGGTKRALLRGSFPILQSAPAKAVQPIRGEGDASVWVWGWPVEGHRYVIGADCKGSDPRGDWHAAVVLDKDVSPHPVVAILHGMWDADTYASHLTQAGMLYNRALISIERNGVGEAVINATKRLYPNLSRELDRRGTKIERLPTDRIGWYTTTGSRNEMIERIAEAIRDEEIITWSEPVVNELLSFHTVPGPRGAEAMAGAHDDLVFALGLALMSLSYTTLGELRHHDRDRHRVASGRNMGEEW